MKGIILAGGAGTRLYPLTMVTSKQFDICWMKKVMIKHEVPKIPIGLPRSGRKC